MINYNTLQRLEEDTDKCGNYITVQYEFPFPEYSVFKQREYEEMRYQLAKFAIRTRKRMLAK